MFTYRYYGELIKELKSKGYNFCSFDSYDVTKQKQLILRHDVDIDIWGTLGLAYEEQQQDVHSIYFFQPNAELYNILSVECIEIIQKLCDMGHQVGLHIDGSIFRNLLHLQKCLDEYYRFYSTFIPLEKVISFHKPTAFMLESDIKLEGFLNTYEKRFFVDMLYVSDSDRREFWSEERWRTMREECPNMQFLTHPIWWSHKGDRDLGQVLMRNNAKFSKYKERALGRIGGKLAQDVVVETECSHICEIGRGK